MENKDITSNDKAVLTRIFNPNLPYGDIFEGNENAMEVEEVETEAVKQAKSLETEGVKQAEAGHIEEALNSFNKAISVAPKHASSYNNRAQALRLQGDVAGALQDLNTAIELSGGHGKVACQAYTQRGLIKRLEEDDEGAIEDLKKAACLGSQFARDLVVSMNPYAAMCNQMLSEVIGKLRSGEGELPVV